MSEIKQEKFKLNFNIVAKTIDGEPMYELKPGMKGKRMQDLSDDDTIETTLNKLLARQIANSSEDFGGKEFEWYQVLYNTGKLELDITDTRVLKGFIANRRKGDAPISNILINQLYKVFKDANFKE